VHCLRYHWGCVLCRLDDNCSDDYIAIFVVLNCCFEPKKGLRILGGQFPSDEEC